MLAAGAPVPSALVHIGHLADEPVFIVEADLIGSREGPFVGIEPELPFVRNGDGLKGKGFVELPSFILPDLVSVAAFCHRESFNVTVSYIYR